jgi:hypothetical protein
MTIFSKLFLYLIKYHHMKTYRGNADIAPPSLTSVLEEDELSESRPWQIYPAPIYRRLGESQNVVE